MCAGLDPTRAPARPRKRTLCRQTGSSANFAASSAFRSAFFAAFSSAACRLRSFISAWGHPCSFGGPSMLRFGQNTLRNTANCLTMFSTLLCNALSFCCYEMASATLLPASKAMKAAVRVAVARVRLRLGVGLLRLSAPDLILSRLPLGLLRCQAHLGSRKLAT